MEHRPFPKIPTTLDDGTSGGARWVATEKIHGAQLVVATDGETVRLGKRKAWLRDEEPFFGWQMLRGELSAKALALFGALGRGGELHLYGELFGGAYPHPEVAALPGISAVQTGIWYAPGIAWAVFDALVVVGDEPPVFLARSQLEALAQEVGLRMPPRLGRGTRAELTRLPVRYPSRVAMSGYDSSAPGQCLCCAYGALRRIGTNGLESRDLHDGASSLFSQTASLVNAVEWMLQADYAARGIGGKRAVRRRDAVKQALIDLLPDVSDIREAGLDEDPPRPRIDVQTPYGWVNLRALSLGYQTMTAWVVDLASRMFEHFRPKGAWRSSDDAPERKPGYYWLAYEWSNLYFACEQCNRRHKRNLFPLEDERARVLSHRDAEAWSPSDHSMSTPGTRTRSCSSAFVASMPSRERSLVKERFEPRSRSMALG